MTIETSFTLLKRRRTKIVATVGPASDDAETIAKLIARGVNVFRLNMSHGTHDSHRAAYEKIRAAAEEAQVAIAVLADLCGPKIRAGKFEGGSIELTEGEEVILTVRDVVGGPGIIPSQYGALAKDVEHGSRVLFDDGQLELRVLDTDGTDARCVVLTGGTLRDRKGINLPGVAISAPALTAKDREDAAFAVELGVDLLALSFVRSSTEVRTLRKIVRGAGGRQGIISKIEKPEALREISDIIDASDGIMVARGDLGVELPAEYVPVTQDELVHRARTRNKPVIVATQMLDSMIRNPRPTRAEVSDVASAIKSGADAVMLSGETAAGRYPIEAVDMLDRTIRHTEGFLWDHGAFGSITKQDQTEDVSPLGRAIGRATAQLSRDLRVRSVVVFSESGTSTRMVSAARPAAPVLAVSSLRGTCCRTQLLWGVLPVHAEPDDLADPHALARALARDLELAEPGHTVLVVRGFRKDETESEPTVSVLTV